MKMSQTKENLDKRANIVEQILEQGQRLRNAMVKSILDNDPFYVDANNIRNLEKNKLRKTASKTIEKNPMCKLNALKSARVMSADLYDIHCNCHICSIYKRELYFANNCTNIPRLHLLNRNQNKFQCAQFTDTDSDDIEGGIPSRLNLQSDTGTSTHMDDKNQNLNPPEQMVKSIQSSYRSKALSYFKYVDSMKVSVQNINLNHAGNRKALASSADIKYRLPISISQSYFVEYNVPSCLISTMSKSNSKVDSGLTCNLFRVCSKKLQNEEIHFKHTSIHDIVNLQQVDLNAIEIKFQISTRTMKQKRSNVLGYATFNMRLFEITKNMCCVEHLPILCDDFVLGTLKVTIQLGCGRLYFGKEFVEFIQNNRKDSVSIMTQKTDVSLNSPSSHTVNSVIFQPNRPKPPNTTPKTLNSDRSTAKSLIEGHIISKEKVIDNEGFASSIGTVRSDLKHVNANSRSSEDPYRNTEVTNDNDNHKIILYGLIYVSEANYYVEGAINSYFSSQAFCLGDTLCSRVVYNSKDPVFNFYQKVPFIYNSSFLNYLRDSIISIDFWERYEEEDISIGTSQLSLHQFYVTYRNPTITNALLENRLPVTIADWFEPICSSVNGKLYGQMKVLVAIGTATQIQNLEVERGLKNESLSVTYVPYVPDVKQKEAVSQPTTSRDSNQIFKKPNYLKPKKKKVNVKPPQTDKDITETTKTVDKAIQSEEQMEFENVTSKDIQVNSQKDVLEALLTELMDQKHKNNLVESATNTDTTIRNQEISVGSSKTNAPNKGLRKTVDLLDYLNGALVFDNKLSSEVTPVKESENNFKAHIIIEGALHLPSRRKCKVKRGKKKNVTYEESLPSTYVSFATITGSDLKYTDVVPKCINPQWDYECDVRLPVDMLTNNQKRLIFKVWCKSNMNSLQPNIDSDVILGFAALDLTVLLAGLPSVQGWFNIIDFSSKCNGQIKIHVTPLEDISKFTDNSKYKPQTIEKNINVKVINTTTSKKTNVLEPPSELLSRELKRKFTEFEEITQRLRSRLADVTKDDSDTSNDDIADEFERDINTLSVEEDYDMLDLRSLSENSTEELLSFSQVENGANQFLLKKANDNTAVTYSEGILRDNLFSKGALSDSAYDSTRAEVSNYKVNSSSRARPEREKQLIDGKPRIDCLLEKLTLLSGNLEDVFSNRHISGCSTNQDNAVPTNVDNTSSENVCNLDAILKPELFNQICSSITSPPSLTDSEDITETNCNSKFGNYRQAPDGAGLNTSSGSTSASSNSTCFSNK